MKKNLIFQLSALLSITTTFTLITQEASSQVLTASLPSDEISAEVSASTPGSSAINEKVAKNFEHAFANAKNLVWEVSNNKYVAHFQSEDRQALAAFSGSGRLNYTVLYGTGKHLPAYEKSLVQEHFTGYTITATQNIIQDQVSVWLVTLEMNGDIYKIKIADNDISILDRMAKRS